MKFDLYYVDIGVYEITINDMVCNTSDAQIENLIEELQNLYTNKNALLWSALNTIEYYYKTGYTEHTVITHICQVEYATVDEFFSNFLAYLATTHPELLL
jgi:hypothetical protein